MAKLPPFDFSREVEYHHGDRSKSTTVSIVAFYRRLTLTWNRPWRP